MNAHKTKIRIKKTRLANYKNYKINKLFFLKNFYLNFLKTQSTSVNAIRYALKLKPSNNLIFLQNFEKQRYVNNFVIKSAFFKRGEQGYLLHSSCI